PLENANAVLVITPQVRYLDQIQQWLDRIDTAGGSARLFSYELRYIKARDLAERLSEAFASSGNRGGSGPASLAPGAIPSQLGGDGDRGMDNNSSTLGSTLGGSSGSSSSNGSLNLPQRQPGN